MTADWRVASAAGNLLLAGCHLSDVSPDDLDFEAADLLAETREAVTEALFCACELGLMLDGGGGC